MTLFGDIEAEFQEAKKSMEKEDHGWWKPVIDHISSVQELIDTLSGYTIKFCIGRHRNEDFGIDPPKLGGSSHDARCLDSIENASCAHHTRLRQLLDLGWSTLGICDNNYMDDCVSQQYDLLEQSIHKSWRKNLRNFHQREYGRGVMVEILEVKIALEIALKSKMEVA